MEHDLVTAVELKVGSVGLAGLEICDGAASEVSGGPARFLTLSRPIVTWSGVPAFHQSPDHGLSFPHRNTPTLVEGVATIP
jgi:hypothetical protein